MSRCWVLLLAIALVGCAPSPPRETVVYGIGAPGVAEGSVLAYAVPSARRLGEFTASGSSGGSFVAVGDASRGYFFDLHQLHELRLPALELLRSVDVPDAVQFLGGSARLLAVAPNGSEVYVETMRGAETGIAAYSTDSGTIVRQVWLGGDACGPAELFALAEQRIGLLCHADSTVRVVDVRDGQQIGTSLRVDGGNAVLAADRKHLYVVSQRSLVQDIELQSQTIARAGNVINCRDCVPNQPLHISADGTRLTLVAARGLPGTVFEVNANVAWVVDTGTFNRLVEVPLGPGTLDALEMPGAQTIVTARQPAEIRVVEMPSGRPLQKWPAPSYSLEVL